MPPDAVSVHENAPFHWTVVWAAQPRLTDNVWLDEPLAAGSDGAASVDGAAEGAPVAGTEGAEGAADVAGLEGVDQVAGLGDLARLLPGLAAFGCGDLDASADGIDAVAGVIDAIADGMTTASPCGWALRLAWLPPPADAPAQAETPRAVTTTAAADFIHALTRLLDQHGRGPRISTEADTIPRHQLTSISLHPPRSRSAHLEPGMITKTSGVVKTFTRYHA